MLINTGAFLLVAKAFAVDISDGEVRVCRIDEVGGEFVPGKCIGTVELGGR